MKTQIIYSHILLATMLLGSVESAFAGRENIGNGNGDLVLKNVLEVNNGLTPEEKIYQLWVEAEGAVPDVNSPDVLGEWYGLNIVNSGDNGSSMSSWMSGVRGPVQEKFRETLFVLSRLSGLKAGPITVKPDTIYGYASLLGNFDGDPDTTYVGTTRARASMKYEGRTDVGDPDQDQFVVHPVEIASTGLRITSILQSYAPYKTEYRQVSPDIIVAVRKALPATDDIGPCPEARREAHDEIKMVDETYKTFFGKTKIRKVPKTVEVVSYKLDPTFAVPGVCEVHLLYKKLK